MRAYTNIEQSKKLAEILPVESADMEYILEQWIDEETYQNKEEYYEIPVVKVDDEEVDDDCPLQPITLPCWSLAALFEVLNMPALTNQNNDDGWDFVINDPKYPDEFIEIHGPNLVDACVEMIFTLKEKDLL